MNAYQDLIADIDSGKLILIDGATGTEVERRGVPQLDHAWNGGAAKSHPQIVIEVHEDYIRHGARVIIANTFANTFQAMSDSGLADEFEEYNRLGIELAVKARMRQHGEKIAVAGGISYWSWTENQPDTQTLYNSVQRQAQVMKDAGADLIILEMMIDTRRMKPTLEAACTVGLPVWIGLTVGRSDEGEIVLRNGESLEKAFQFIDPKQIPLIALMHTDVELIADGIKECKRHWNGYLGVYSHSGSFENNKMVFEDCISPDEYCAAAKQWVESGIQLIGGCCGVGPRHIKRLRNEFF